MSSKEVFADSARAHINDALSSCSGIEKAGEPESCNVAICVTATGLNIRSLSQCILACQAGLQF